MEQAVFFGKDHKTGHCCHGVPQPCGNGCPGDPHIQYGDEDIVQDYIQNSSRNGTDHGKSGLSGGDHVQGEIVHQKDRNRKDQITAQIDTAVAGHGGRQVHGSKKAVHDQIAQAGHDESHRHVYSDQKGEVFVGFLGFLLSGLPHDDGAPSGGQHGGDGCDQ